MKFESKFGLGEIVIYAPKVGGDSLMEVQGVYFGMDGKKEIICRYLGTGLIASFSESQLKGDPNFDQETGYNLED